MSSSIVKPFRSIVSLSYKILGVGTNESKPPIFIFHGLLGHKGLWSGIGKTIMNITQRTVVVVDLRNHGRSPHAKSHKYKDQAKDVLLLLETLGARQASLIGYSIGGRTAMSVALMAPHKVAGLLIIEMSPLSLPTEYKARISTLLEGMKAVDFSKANQLSKAKTLARTQLKRFNTQEEIMKIVVSNIERKTDGSFGWICNVDALLKEQKHWISFPEEMKKMTYDGPTLFVGGQLSDFIPPDELNMIRMMFPRAVITYVHKAGHTVHLDDPHAFMVLAISFLRTHETAPTTQHNNVL